ncbi:MAG: response regulator transcription factor [Ilumatobacteraceae bacterium]
MDVLLVEDDDAIASSLIAGLQSSGMSVRRVSRGEDALRAELPDVVLLDVGLPDIDGFEVCRRLRVTSQVPVIMLTARNEELDRVFGLEIGADDYVTKPFGLRELVARIKAVTRRAAAFEATENSVIVVGQLSIDRLTRRAMLDGEELALTTKEFDLLAYLAERSGIVHRRNDILETVWDTNWYGPTKTLDAHVAAVRKKLGNPKWIEAVRGVGFRLESPE